MNIKTIAQAEAEVEARENAKLNLLNLSEEQKKSYKLTRNLNSKVTTITRNSQNIRNLFSSNNQYPDVD